MSVQHLPNGVTVSSGPDSLASQIDWSDPSNPKLPGYRLAVNPDGGIVATKNNGFYDIGVPILIGSIFAIGAATGGAGFAGAGGASTTAPIADLSGAPAFGAGGAGVINGVDLGAGGVNALPVIGNTVGGSVASFLKNPSNVAKLAALYPAIKTFTDGNDGTNGNSPFNPNSPFMQGAQHSMDVANKRLDQSQPIYDSVVNMAYGRTPTIYRSNAGAPSTYSGDKTPAGAYTYDAPRFG